MTLAHHVLSNFSGERSISSLFSLTGCVESDSPEKLINMQGRSKEPLAADANGLALLSPSLHGQIHAAREPAAQATGAASLSDPASCSSIGSPLESCTDKSDPAPVSYTHLTLPTKA